MYIAPHAILSINHIVKRLTSFFLLTALLETYCYHRLGDIFLSQREVVIIMVCTW